MRKIKEGTTICNLNDLLFPVEIRKETMPSNSEYAYKIVGQLNGGDFLLNQCSDRYELVKNVDIFPNIENVLKSNNINFDLRYSHFNNARFYADYVIENQEYAYKMIGTNDIIKPVIYVTHSYNGLTKYQIVFGYFRLVCSNGLTIPVKEMHKFNLSIVGKHTATIVKSFEMLDTTLKFFANNAKQVTTEITQKFELLGGRWISNPKDRIIEVLNVAKIADVENKEFSTINYMLNIIKKEANNTNLGYNGKVNDWLIYNAINQYVNDDSRTIAVPEKKREIDSKVLEYMLS